jgi:hypothetical protein
MRKSYWLGIALMGLILACTASPATTLPPPSDTPTASTVQVSVYFTVGDPVHMYLKAAPRRVPFSTDPVEMIRATMLELLRGPTDAEKVQGLVSWFSASTADTLRSVSLLNGELSVDVTGWPALIPNASTSAGSYMLLSQMNQTLFQFDQPEEIWYSLDGGCAAFWEWLQYGCHPVTRAEWALEPTQ